MYAKFIYKRVNWLNKSESLTTPLGKHNLNNMDSAIYNIAENLDIVHTEMDTGKFDKSDADKVIVGMPTWNPNTGILAFRFYDGTTFQVDFNVEKIPVSFSMNSAGVITMTTSDGTKWTADIGDVMPAHTYTDSDTIAFFDTKDGDYEHTVSAEVKIGSIKEEHIQPKYLADVTEQAAKAAENAELAGDYEEDAAYDAKLAQSYAVGGSGIREGEDADSAKFYKEEAEKTAKAVEDRLNSMQDVSVTVDSDLNSTSENPVQNKTLYSKISNIDNTADKDKIVASAATAAKLDTDAGSSNKPVYISNGKPVACSYAINKTVPSNAIFTDTTNTAGSTTTTAKRYLVGTSTTGSSSAVTNTNNNCYMSGGYLYSNGEKVDISDINNSLSQRLSLTFPSTYYSPGTQWLGIPGNQVWLVVAVSYAAIESNMSMALCSFFSYSNTQPILVGSNAPTISMNSGNVVVSEGRYDFLVAAYRLI